jgi:hypothetical protein
MKKQKKWVAVEDYDELVAEVAELKRIQTSMHECIGELVLTGNRLVKNYTVENRNNWICLVDTF